jgi:hypothetical protein
MRQPALPGWLRVSHFHTHDFDQIELNQRCLASILSSKFFSSRGAFCVFGFSRQCLINIFVISACGDSACSIPVDNA